jgi:hypothetical protein
MGKVQGDWSERAEGRLGAVGRVGGERAGEDEGCTWVVCVCEDGEERVVSGEGEGMGGGWGGLVSGSR